MLALVYVVADIWFFNSIHFSNIGGLDNKEKKKSLLTFKVITTKQSLGLSNIIYP